MKPATLVGILVVVALLLAAAWYFFWAEEIPGPEPVYYWPLTGEIAPDSDAIRTRVVSVKVENSPAARPQDGLAEADLVYETLSEGGIPRFNALFHSALPERVGPVRSARFSDTYIVPQYGALFAYSGASQATRERIGAANIDDLGMERHSGLYERDPARAAPHNVYASVAAIQAAAGDAGYATSATVPALLFGELSEEMAEAPGATRLHVPFAGDNDATWTWDEELALWLRSVGGQPHADAATGERYAASNVVVLYAETRETDLRDTTGAVVLDIVLDGSGDAMVLRDGRRYDVRWSASPDAPLRFERADGSELPLAAGRTWVQVVPPGYDLSID